jgi:hypothetical protein
MLNGRGLDEGARQRRFVGFLPVPGAGSTSALDIWTPAADAPTLISL